MDHPNQNTMLLPASYAVISEEEMTYLDGGQSIYLGSAFNHDIYFNTDQFATFCQNAAINLFVLMTNYSFRYIAGRVQSGLSNGLSLSGTFYHTWDKMNTWSRIASVGVAGLAGVYVYSQVMNVIRTVTSIYDQIVNEYNDGFSYGNWGGFNLLVGQLSVLHSLQTDIAEGDGGTAESGTLSVPSPFPA